MKKLTQLWNRNKKANWIIFFASLVLWAGFNVFYYYVLNTLHRHFLLSILDSSFVIFAVYFSIATIMVVTYFGMFDTVGYGFSSLIHFTFNYKKPKKYNDLLDYRDQRVEKRKAGGAYYLPLYFSSVILLVVIIILRLMITLL